MPLLAPIAPATQQAPGTPDLQRILKINVPIIVKLAERKVNVQEVLKLGIGSIIEFHKSADEPMELLINNKTIALGIAVKCTENFGIKLTQVGDPRALIQALGAER